MFFEKKKKEKEHLCLIHHSIFSFATLFSISITLHPLLISLLFPIHPLKDVDWCSRKKKCSLNFHNHPSIISKKAAPKTFGKFPVKNLWWIP